MTEIKFSIVLPQGKSDKLTKNNVLALGTFDGVHIAHKELFDRARELKSELGCDRVGAWCFSDAPAVYLKNETVPQLTPIDEKIALMFECGLDFVVVGSFEDFRNVSAEDFVNDVLIDRLGCVGAVCGFNHKFGKMGLGNVALLQSKLGKDRVVEVGEIRLFGETVSSTAIRDHISSGEIEKANLMLGRAYAIKSEVVRGKRLGRKLHFPTANQFFPPLSPVPKRGIYTTVCIIDGKKFAGVSNVGIRPTIADGSDSHIFNCETYIIDFEGDIYGKELTVEFHSYLRQEMRFESVEELVYQIAQDRYASLNYFSKNPDCLKTRE